MNKKYAHSAHMKGSDIYVFRIFAISLQLKQDQF